MRIIYFTDDYTPHDHRFLSALARTSHRVFLLRLQKRASQIEDRPVPAGIEQVLWVGGRRPFRWRTVPALIWDLRRVIRRIDPDIIHAGPIQTCAFIAVLSGFQPVLSMSWGFDLQEDARRGPGWRLITSYTLQHSAFFTCDAGVTRDLAIRYGMRPDRVSVFPWGVDLKHFKPNTVGATRRQSISPSRTKERDASRPFVMLCNRSWEPRYGVDTLAKAFSLAAARNPRLGLILLGTGSQGGAIRQVLGDGDVLDRVQFGGRVSQADLPAWYGRADLFISPSHIDGSSVSLMEALACGLPVLVSDIPANREWVRDDTNGWCFPDGNAEALAEKILWIAGRVEELGPIGRQARKVAEERADWKQNFPVLLDSYERAVRFHAAGDA